MNENPLTVSYYAGSLTDWLAGAKHCTCNCKAIWIKGEFIGNIRYNIRAVSVSKKLEQLAPFFSRHIGDA